MAMHLHPAPLPRANRGLLLHLPLPDISSVTRLNKHDENENVITASHARAISSGPAATPHQLLRATRVLEHVPAQLLVI